MQFCWKDPLLCHFHHFTAFKFIFYLFVCFQFFPLKNREKKGFSSVSFLLGDMVAGDGLTEDLCYIIIQTLKVSSFICLQLGAFLAGATLAEKNFRTQIEADIKPFRGLLLGLFFVTTGSSIDMQVLIREWPNVFSLLAGLIVIKTLIISALGPRFGLILQESVRHLESSIFLFSTVMAPVQQFCSPPESIPQKLSWSCIRGRREQLRLFSEFVLPSLQFPYSPVLRT